MINQLVRVSLLGGLAIGFSQSSTASEAKIQFDSLNGRVISEMVKNSNPDYIKVNVNYVSRSIARDIVKLDQQYTAVLEAVEQGELSTVQKVVNRLSNPDVKAIFAPIVSASLEERELLTKQATAELKNQKSKLMAQVEMAQAEFTPVQNVWEAHLKQIDVFDKKEKELRQSIAIIDKRIAETNKNIIDAYNAEITNGELAVKRIKNSKRLLTAYFTTTEACEASDKHPIFFKYNGVCYKSAIPDKQFLNTEAHQFHATKLAEHIAMIDGKYDSFRNPQVGTYQYLLIENELDRKDALGTAQSKLGNLGEVKYEYNQLKRKVDQANTRLEQLDLDKVKNTSFRKSKYEFSWPFMDAMEGIASTALINETLDEIDVVEVDLDNKFYLDSNVAMGFIEILLTYTSPKSYISKPQPIMGNMKSNEVFQFKVGKGTEQKASAGQIALHKMKAIAQAARENKL